MEYKKKEQGNVAIIVTLGLTALIGMGALVADVGVLYARHAHLQNALDAAALAGVQELPQNTDRAKEVATAYAAENGVNGISVEFRSGNAEIVVRAEESVPAYLATIWGIKESTIGASSRAIMVPPQSLSGAVPLSVEEQDFVYGEEYTLKSGANGGKKDKDDFTRGGWFGALELSGNGARNYETDLANGYQGTLSIGQVLEVKHGNMSGPTSKGISERLDRDTRVPRNTFADFDRDAPEIIYLPIVKVLSHNGNSVHEVEIVGFAAFFLEGVEGNGVDSIVRGRFLRTVVTRGQAGGSLADLLKSEQEMEDGNTLSDFGLYAPKLLAN
ncbi:Tad domain-containing protein [Paradesulfitobacterium ferrireducens]|uniref:Tad domain-containing protein n=1 Tax=Paradesulfitobacterium ferrireducens TaxID=2816476 RepID=UPI001A8C7C7A|nr:Tad domain-containing protein [Paradesulfitobacterium ferrireducens]